jgi:DTW domain-containing protein YfiP
MTDHPPRRALCGTCRRPRSSCICQWIVAAPFDARLLILQHPLEIDQAKGSGRLLHLCVPGSVLLSGEIFDSDSLHQALYGDGRTPVLLYPASDAPSIPAALALALPASALRLVVLDGTWRKSRKMLHLNPLLAALPRLALSDMAPSRYRIRKAHAPDQLSSFEAAAHALAQLQGDASAGPALEDLMAAFDGFVGQQAAYAAAGKSA